MQRITAEINGWINIIPVSDEVASLSLKRGYIEVRLFPPLSIIALPGASKSSVPNEPITVRLFYRRKELEGWPLFSFEG